MATDCLFKITLKLKKVIEKDGALITHINIPCGKCGRCIERRKMEWGFRMEQEMYISKTAYFVTLTYDPEHVPYNQYGQKTLIETRNEDLQNWKQTLGIKRMTKQRKKKLPDRSLQGFMKRLRRNQERTDETIEHLFNNLKPHDKIKFYAAGEYGEEKGRPHYHAIIFNASATNIIKSWSCGSVHCVRANESTISYVMKYLDKHYSNEKEWKRKPEFNTMSEGIGTNYIEKNKYWHKQNIDILYVTTMKGIKIPMPKYYREKLFTDDERTEQVKIVTGVLYEIKQERIREVGYDYYNQEQADLKKESQRRFIKKIKKRIVD